MLPPSVIRNFLSPFSVPRKDMLLVPPPRSTKPLNVCVALVDVRFIVSLPLPAVIPERSFNEPDTYNTYNTTVEEGNDNTMLYVGIGGAALLVVVLLIVFMK